MSYQINYFGWNNEVEDGKQHDKVWGYVTVGDHLYNFWGRRNKSLTFKDQGVVKVARYYWESTAADELRKLANKKTEKGYVPIPVDKIEEICGDGFFDSFEKQLTLAKLFDKFHRAPGSGYEES